MIVQFVHNKISHSLSNVCCEEKINLLSLYSSQCGHWHKELVICLLEPCGFCPKKNASSKGSQAGHRIKGRGKTMPWIRRRSKVDHRTSERTR